MVDEAAALPEDLERLRELVRERSAERDLAYQALKLKTLEVEKLKMQLMKLRRIGQSSEKLAREVAQLELAIEEIEAGEAVVAPVTLVASVDPVEAAETGETVPADKHKPGRRRLPEHLPRETVGHAPAAACPDCAITGGGLKRNFTRI